MTTRRWSSRTRSQPKIISRAASVVLAAATFAGLAPRVRANDSAPDWLRAAAQQKLPEYDKDTNAVILLDETQTTVQNNGQIDTLHREAIRILRPEGKREYGGVAVPYDKETKVAYVKGWTIESNGHEIAASDKDIFDRSYFDDVEYTDARIKGLPFPEAEPGNVVGFEYVQKGRPYILEDSWWFQDTSPVVTARLVLQLPPGWEFTTAWFNYPEQQPQTAGSNRYVWEVKNLPGIETEPDMPPWKAVAGWAGVKYFPADPALRAKFSGTWKDLGLWHANLTQSSRAPSPQIKQKVADLTSAIPDTLGKMRAITDYMQRNIRYYAVEIGIGGYQPHPASEVFAHQFGDCKDKATLLGSMLGVLGLQTYYVVVHTNRGFVHPNYPSLDSFNHVILAIHLPDDVPDAGLYAIVHDANLGKLLIFDPTNEYVPLGYLPWYLQDNYGLLVAPDGGELISLPLLPPSTNRLLRTGKFTMTSNGSLIGDVQELEWGGPAAQERRAFLTAEPAKRSEIFDGFLTNFLASFTLTGASLGNLDKYDDVLSLNYKFVSPAYANAAGDLLFVRPRVVGDKNTGMLRLFTEHKPRKYPIEFEEATRQDDVFDISLPAGYVVDGLPQPVQADCDYASYRSETKFADGVLHYKRTFEIKDVMVPKEKLPAVRDFLQQVAADQQSAAVLRRVASAPN